MAIIEFVERKDKGKSIKTYRSMKNAINYIKNPIKTEPYLVGGKDCNPDTAYDEFVVTKEMYNKGEDGKRRQAIHFVQSFNPEDNITPEIAKEIAEKLLEFELFKDFAVVYATHTNTKKLHTHYIINTVNTETGMMWHISKQDLQNIKDYSDQLCKEYGLSIIEEKQKHNHVSSGEYRSKQRGMSWKNDLIIAVDKCKNSSTSKEDFILNIEKLGYKVEWTDAKKYITFITADGKRCRNRRFENYEKYTKEELLKVFEINKQLLKDKDIETANEEPEDINKVEPEDKANKEPKSKSMYGDEQNASDIEKDTEKKNTWRYRLFKDVVNCKVHSKNRENFIENMNKKGYKVDWSDERKYITFTTPDGKKCRNNKLYPPEQFTKEAFEEIFETNKAKYELLLAVKHCKRCSQSKDEFISNMNKLGYEVDWSDDGNIKFTTPGKKKFRNLDLYPPEKYTKKVLEEAFNKNGEYLVKKVMQSRMNVLLDAIKAVSSDNTTADSQYPLTSLEGIAARKERALEEAKGRGLDWSKAHGEHEYGW